MTTRPHQAFGQKKAPRTGGPGRNPESIAAVGLAPSLRY